MLSKIGFSVSNEKKKEYATTKNQKSMKSIMPQLIEILTIFCVFLVGGGDQESRGTNVAVVVSWNAKD